MSTPHNKAEKGDIAKTVLKREDFDRDDFFAAGNKSQIVYVSPKANLVLVRFGEKDGIDFWKWISVFYDFASEC